MENIDEFTKGYLVCALWATNYEDEVAMDTHHGIEDIEAESLAKQIEICAQFQKENESALQAYYAQYSESQAGHDFFLTSRRHGAGFWDRKINQNTVDNAPDAVVVNRACDRLTEASHKYSEESPYIGDDDKVYFD